MKRLKNKIFRCWQLLKFSPPAKDNNRLKLLPHGSAIRNYCSLVVLVTVTLLSCDKVPVEFGTEGTAGDPNIITIDTFALGISTLQVDSFSTKNPSLFVTGSHQDPLLGYIESKAFFEIVPPATDLTNCTNCRFDSLVLYTKVASGYQGDTSVPFTLNIHEVTQTMNDEEFPLGYNVSTVAYSPLPMASTKLSIRPARKDDIKVRLPDAFGQNLYRMLRTKSDTITSSERFKTFFKGICMATASTNNALYYFEKPTTTNAIIKLHYTIAGAIPKTDTLSFLIDAGCYNFNAFTYNKNGTSLAAFTPKKKQLISSTLTRNQAFLHYNSGLFPKIAFGNLFAIKELHPYIQVLKAELLVKPVKQTYGIKTWYSLPPAVELRVTDDDNGINGSTLAFPNSTVAQTGSLFLDNLYGEGTVYTYDVTSLVNTILAEGVFSRRALILYPDVTAAAFTDQRLIISNSNDATNATKLKLTILGL